VNERRVNESCRSRQLSLPQCTKSSISAIPAPSPHPRYDHLEFHIEAGATLLGSTLEDDYPLIPILPSYGTGRDVDSEQRYVLTTWAFCK
jgi:hypothetical protein